MEQSTISALEAELLRRLRKCEDEDREHSEACTRRLAAEFQTWRSAARDVIQELRKMMQTDQPRPVDGGLTDCEASAHIKLMTEDVQYFTERFQTAKQGWDRLGKWYKNMERDLKSACDLRTPQHAGKVLALWFIKELISAKEEEQRVNAEIRRAESWLRESTLLCPFSFAGSAPGIALLPSDTECDDPKSPPGLVRQNVSSPADWPASA